MLAQLARGRLASGSVDPVPAGRVLVVVALDPVAWEPTMKKKEIIFIMTAIYYF